MKSKCLKSFWKSYQALPESIKKLAEKNYLLWKQNPSHHSLRFKPIGDGFWSLRVGIHYRAVGYPEGDEIIWVWIGHHSEYDQNHHGAGTSSPYFTDYSWRIYAELGLTTPKPINWTASLYYVSYTASKAVTVYGGFTWGYQIE